MRVKRPPNNLEEITLHRTSLCTVYKLVYITKYCLEGTIIGFFQGYIHLHRGMAAIGVFSFLVVFDRCEQLASAEPVW